MSDTMFYIYHCLFVMIPNTLLIVIQVCLGFCVSALTFIIFLTSLENSRLDKFTHTN